MPSPRSARPITRACAGASAWLAGLALASLLTQSPPALAKTRAKFIEGTYAMDGGCAKLKAIAAGGPKNVETTPETLTADGFESWEGGCSFVWIKEKQQGRRWVAEMACAEEAEESVEIDTFDLDPASGTIKVTNEGKTSAYVRCDEGKGN